MLHCGKPVKPARVGTPAQPLRKKRRKEKRKEKAMGKNSKSRKA
jgi:hypothetical protein